MKKYLTCEGSFYYQEIQNLLKPNAITTVFLR